MEEFILSNRNTFNTAQTLDFIHLDRHFLHDKSICNFNILSLKSFKMMKILKLSKSSIYNSVKYGAPLFSRWRHPSGKTTTWEALAWRCTPNACLQISMALPFQRLLSIHLSISISYFIFTGSLHVVLNYEIGENCWAVMGTWIVMALK